MSTTSNTPLSPATPTSTVGVQQRLILKQTAIDTWSVKEQLGLASAVLRSGDQNWVSVSRQMKPFSEDDRPADWFSQKNCALQYNLLLETVDTPRRKRGNERASIESAETPGEAIVKRLTADRLKELRGSMETMSREIRLLQKDCDDLEDESISEDRLNEIEAVVEAEEREEARKKKEHEKWLEKREEKKRALQAALKAHTMKLPLKGAAAAAVQQAGAARRASTQQQVDVQPKVEEVEEPKPVVEEKVEDLPPEAETPTTEPEKQQAEPEKCEKLPEPEVESEPEEKIVEEAPKVPEDTTTKDVVEDMDVDSQITNTEENDAAAEAQVKAELEQEAPVATTKEETHDVVEEIRSMDVEEHEKVVEEATKVVEEATKVVEEETVKPKEEESIPEPPVQEASDGAEKGEEIKSEPSASAKEMDSVDETTQKEEDVPQPEETAPGTEKNEQTVQQEDDDEDDEIILKIATESDEGRKGSKKPTPVKATDEEHSLEEGRGRLRDTRSKKISERSDDAEESPIPPRSKRRGRKADSSSQDAESETDSTPRTSRVKEPLRSNEADTESDSATPPRQSRAKQVEAGKCRKADEADNEPDSGSVLENRRLSRLKESEGSRGRRGGAASRSSSPAASSDEAEAGQGRTRRKSGRLPHADSAPSSPAIGSEGEAAAQPAAIGPEPPASESEFVRSALKVLSDVAALKALPALIDVVAEDVVKRTIDIASIKKSAESGDINTPDGLANKLAIMFLNVVMSVSTGSEMHEMALATFKQCCTVVDDAFASNTSKSPTTKGGKTKGEEKGRKRGSDETSGGPSGKRRKR